jgi:hypothetical protein
MPSFKGAGLSLEEWLKTPLALGIGRLAVENRLIELRDSRIAVLRNNGCCIKERDGSASSIIRMGPETAIQVGLEAMIAAYPRYCQE